MLVVNDFKLNIKVGSASQTLLTLPYWKIQPGEFVALLGPNGAGKSSLLKALCGEHAYQGDVFLYKKILSHWSGCKRARQIGVLPQSGQLSFPFQAHEVVALGLLPLNISRAEGNKLIAEAMEKTQCDHLFDRNFPQLSGGEKQRVHLARVLVQISQAQQPPLILLDEPVSAQDLHQQHLILQLAKQLAEEQRAMVLAVLHDLNQALRYCHRATVIRNGELFADGKPDQILSEQLVDRVWGYQAEKVTTGRGAVLI
jgi:iron complex transport system ATP-binding protein